MNNIDFFVNNAMQFLQKTCSQFSEDFRTLYEAKGINEILKQEYQVSLGTGYIIWLLYSIKHKQVMPEEVKDATLIIRCKEEYSNV